MIYTAITVVRGYSQEQYLWIKNTSQVQYLLIRNTSHVHFKNRFFNKNYPTPLSTRGFFQRLRGISACNIATDYHCLTGNQGKKYATSKQNISFFCILSMDARYCCLSCGTNKISWVTLDQLAYGQLTLKTFNEEW